MVNVKTKSGSTLEIESALYDFVKNELVKDTDWDADSLFNVLGELVEKFGGKNQTLLNKRKEIQSSIDNYYVEKRKTGWKPTVDKSEQDAGELEEFLIEIGYLSSSNNPTFRMTTPSLDAEMNQNGPELVTPVSNASMVVGGANARWGSLYDAYFLSDIHPEIDKDSQRSERLRMVVDATNDFLDEWVVQWQGGMKFGDMCCYSISTSTEGIKNLLGHPRNGDPVSLTDAVKFKGYNLDEKGDISDFLLEDNGLCIQCHLYEGGTVDPNNGQFKDLIVESAVTNIIDFEDAVSIVDVEDMVGALRNYLQLLRGDLKAYGSRGNLKAINSDKTYLDIYGTEQKLKGTCLLSVRNVSLHMYTDIVKLNGEEIPERMLGLLITSFIASKHDKGSDGERDGSDGVMPVRGPNSAKGYIYQVTPKLNTSDEVSEQMNIFSFIEDSLGIKSGGILIGIMNEELGMTLQLSESLNASQGRTFFINTGFLDRTGSQIRAQMHAGPVDLRDDLTQAKYNTSYELHNVQIGIQKGVHVNGKIGKGMQVKNRSMAEMMSTKINHPRTGGNTAWVPAPYPSDLHSMHYHMINVDEIQQGMEDSPSETVTRQAILNFPVLDPSKVADDQKKQSLIQRYIHSMLAYSEPWVNRGIGCSGVANFDAGEEMKDRATERIDGAILANWKLHNVITQDEIEDAMFNVAQLVDKQNEGVEGYLPLTGESLDREHFLSNPAIASVLGVIDDSLTSASGYVEPALFKNRKIVKG